MASSQAEILPWLESQHDWFEQHTQDYQALFVNDNHLFHEQDALDFDFQTFGDPDPSFLEDLWSSSIEIGHGSNAAANSPMEALEDPSSLSSNTDNDFLFNGVLHPQPDSRLRNEQPPLDEAKERYCRIPNTAKMALEEMFQHNPYPNTGKVDEIAQRIGLSAKRVKTWFGNARSRKIPPDVSPEHAQGINRKTVRGRLSQENLETLDKQEQEKSQGQSSIITQSVYSETHTDKARSVASSGRSSARSFQSRYSSASQKSNISSRSTTRKQGRKRFSVLSNADSELLLPRDPSVYRYQCTFCWKRFKSKYEWTRHEETVHVQQSSWVCCLIPREEMKDCPFCQYPDVDDRHLESHGYFDCSRQPEEARTFYRKDHLLQHVNNIHRKQVCLDGSSITASDKKLVSLCKSERIELIANDPALYCGFCGRWSSTWKSRCNHIAEHYIKDEQYDRRAWWPGRLDTLITADQSVDASNDKGFRCKMCGISFSSPSEHSMCRTWSCRFILDSRSLFPWASEGKLWCILCDSYADPKDHCASHRYRQCSQDLYTSQEEFKEHLHSFHYSAEPSVLGAEFLGPEFSRVLWSSF